MFVPITMRGLMIPGWKGFENRQSYWAYLFARLKPGVSIEQARDGAERPVPPDRQRRRGAAAEGHERSDDGALQGEDRSSSSRDGAARARSTREARTPLILLLSVTGIVLLIACANIANLLLARAARAARRRWRCGSRSARAAAAARAAPDRVVRARGARRRRRPGRRALDAGAASRRCCRPTRPRRCSSSCERPVVLFAAALSIGTGLLFGLFPALHSTRPDLVSTLKAQAGPAVRRARGRALPQRRSSRRRSRSRWRCSSSAGLFVKSLMNVSRVDLGLKIDNVVTFGVSPGAERLRRRRARGRSSSGPKQELAAIPGVTGVAASMVPLLAGSNWGSRRVGRGLRARSRHRRRRRDYNEISPGYFRTLGVPLIAGREFTAADAAGAPKVAIVNEAFAKKFNLGRDAVGKRMSAGGPASSTSRSSASSQNAKYSRGQAGGAAALLPAVPAGRPASAR